MLSTAEIRSLFIDFFSNKNHQIVKSSSLIPAQDPTLLFVNAGMVQFKDVFLGAEKKTYTRATSSQRCVRAGGKHNDLDQVGYTARHHTFFEMLGNFSFGDYFKKEAIGYAWELLTDILKLPQERLWVTVYEEDDEAEKIWRDEIGFPVERISRIGAKDNFWQMGDTGPCGPCTEIFYDHGESIPGGPPGTAEEDGDRYIEIWNLVFMQYDRHADGSLHPLPNPCVDTGMGLERIASILQGKHNNYDIDLFQALIQKAAVLTGCQDTSNNSLKVIADHIRTCSFLISDGVLPANEGRGYVLRRIIRRALRHGYKLNVRKPFFHLMLPTLIEQMGEAYPELERNKKNIDSYLLKEEVKFARTLETGMQLFQKATEQLDGSVVPGDVAFKLYDTYGFPLDLTQDVAREQGKSVDIEGFNVCMRQQQELSGSGSEFSQKHQLSADIVKDLKPTVFTGYKASSGAANVAGLFIEGKPVQQVGPGMQAQIILDQTPFYAESGGQVGDIGHLSNDQSIAQVLDTQKISGQYHLHEVKITKGNIHLGDSVTAKIDRAFRKKVILNHSATHLLHKVLKDCLGEHVQQKGSLVNADKLRFDFSHEAPLTKEQLHKVEQQVNAAIRNNYATCAENMSYDDAIQSGAIALFGEKYGDQVRVLNMGDFSVELCGGTHVAATGDIGLFKILEESSVASGVRRIEAITGESALKYIQTQSDILDQASKIFNVVHDRLPTMVQGVVDKNRQLEKQSEEIQKKQFINQIDNVFQKVEMFEGINYLYHIFQGIDDGLLREVVDKFKSAYDPGVIVLANTVEQGKIQVVVGVTHGLTKKVRAGDVIKQVLQPMNGRGGGRPDFAQGGADGVGADIQKLILQVIDKLKASSV